MKVFYRRPLLFLLGFLSGIWVSNLPRILFMGTPLKTSHIQTNEASFRIHVRETYITPNPRYKDFLFVGVMTTREYVNTRAATIYKTWGRFIPGKIVFFVGKGRKYRGNLPVVVLDDAEDQSYPPQRKCFAMLKYIYDHYLNDFEWFMRADDDSVVKPDVLEIFLRSINSTKPIYMGQYGMGISEEFGQLGLNKPYCMGGPGVFFTQSTLFRMGNDFSPCLNGTITSHEDTELGRCVYMKAGVPCTTSYEFSKLFYQNYEEKKGTFTRRLGPELGNALTLHPVKNSSYVYRLLNYLEEQRIRELQQKVFSLRRAIRDIDIRLKGPQTYREMVHSEFLNQIEQIPDKNQDSFKDMYSDVEWDFLRYKTIYSIRKLQDNIDLKGRRQALNDTVRSIIKKVPKALPVAYQKVVPGKGILHLLGTPPDLKRSPVWTSTGLEKIHFKGVPDMPDPSSAVHIILPIYQRSQIYVQFLKALKSVSVDFEGAIDLIVIIHHDKEGEYKQLLSITEPFLKATDKLKTKVIELTNNFSRGIALLEGVKGLSNDSLVLAMDVDMVFNVDFLNRVVANTHYGSQAYFPVYFCQYHPMNVCDNPSNCVIQTYNFSQDHGLWRHFSYGIVSVYRGDMLRVGGYDTSIVGWGKEDTDFFEKCLKANMTTFRAIDPGLVHIFHDRFCDPSLPEDQLNMCYDTRFALFGSETVLTNQVDKLILW